MSAQTTVPDEFELEQQAIEAKRRLGILCLGSAVGTFVVVAFLGEFLLATPARLGSFELTKGHAYLLAPLLAMIVAGVLYRLKRSATRSFLDVELARESADGAVDPEDARLFADARQKMRAKMASGAAAIGTLVVGHVAVQSYYTYQNELPRDSYAYVPQLRLQIGESAAILLVAVIVMAALYRVLAPTNTREAEQRAALDDDTKDLYAGVVRGSRKAKLATLVGTAVGLGVSAAVFNLLVWQLEPRSAFDLRLLFGTVLAGILVGGAVRKAMLPASMQDEGALDLATLPAGSTERLAGAIRSGFTLARRPSLLDLVGLETRLPAQYDLLAGDSMEGAVQEQGGSLGAMLLGGERAMSLIISDIESRTLLVHKAALGGQLQVQDADGNSLGRVRRSRVPFVTALVVEEDAAPAEPIRLSKRWLSKRYVARRGGADIAEVQAAAERTGANTVRQLQVSMEGRDDALWVLAGVLAMDLI